MLQFGPLKKEKQITTNTLPRASIHWADRRLIARSREVSKPHDWQSLNPNTLFADFGRKTPLFQTKSLILKPNKTPLFKQNAFVRYIRLSTIFVKVRITVSNSRHFMHSNSNMRNKQVEINTCKILPLSKILMDPFSWFREFGPPIEKITLFRENGYGGWILKTNPSDGRSGSTAIVSKCVLQINTWSM